MTYRIDSSVGTFVCGSSVELDRLLRRIDAELLEWYVLTHDNGEVLYDSRQDLAALPLVDGQIDDCFTVQLGNQIMTNKRLDKRDAKQAELDRLCQLRIDVQRDKLNNREVYAKQFALGQDLEPMAVNEDSRNVAYIRFGQLLGLDVAEEIYLDRE